MKTRADKRSATKLKVGDPAPAFSTIDGEGQSVSLADFAGRTVVLYFYPRDNTPGCTKEACAFRDQHAKLRRHHAVVLGVSTDSARSHRKFAEKFDLPFPLLVDEDRKIAEAYGVWGEKTFMGRRFMGTLRQTFLIGTDGRLRQIWDKVKPDTHAAEVLAALAVD
jgi:thioredoxin-dependent peroxiredoxin